MMTVEMTLDCIPQKAWEGLSEVEIDVVMDRFLDAIEFRDEEPLEYFPVRAFLYVALTTQAKKDVKDREPGFLGALHGIYREHGLRPFQRATSQSIDNCFMIFITRRISRNLKRYRLESSFYDLVDSFQRGTFTRMLKYRWLIMTPLD